MPNGQNYRGKRINYALAATLVMSGMSMPEVATQVGAKNANVLRVGLAKRGVTVAKVRSIQSAATSATSPGTPGNRSVMSITAKLATEASGIIAESGRKLRQSLASASEQSAAILEQKPAKNVKEVIQRVSALKGLAETGDRVHGWSAQSAAPTFNVTILDMDLPGCGVDTPTSGVPASLSDVSAPQSAQVIDVESVVM